MYIEINYPENLYQETKQLLIITSYNGVFIFHSKMSRIFNSDASHYMMALNQNQIIFIFMQ